jgi:hypothetical protein
MRINEDTPGSIAHQETVKILKGWLLALYVLDVLVCLFGASMKNLSLMYAGWFFLKSLLFSYGAGFFVLFVLIRFLGRAMGVRVVKPVAILRICVVFACLSVIMGSLLVYREPAGPPVPWAHPDGSH